MEAVKTEAGANSPKKDLDPKAFAQKLTFTDEVAALGISEEDRLHARKGLLSHPQRRW